ncbi:unnamed protein product [Penicillium olsonii]|nr:unnamed protein product [Penicillium olsonii]
MRNIVNLGIFGKGKTSSPNCPPDDPSISCTKPLPYKSSSKRKSGSDLAFSEMTFFSNPFSQKSHPGNNPRPALAEKTLFDHSDKHQVPTNPSEAEILSTQIPPIVMEREVSNSPPPPPLDYFKDLAHRGPPKSDVFEDAHVEHAQEPHSLTSPPRDPGQISNHQSKVDIFFKLGRRKRTSSRRPSNGREASLEPPNKKGKISKRSSSTLYTWSESEKGHPGDDHALEKHLLALMHVGLNREEISRANSLPCFSDKYWSLPELKTLLDERMGLWSDELDHTGPTQQIPDPSIQSLTPNSSARGRSGLFNVGSIREKVFGRLSGQKTASDTSCDMCSGISQTSSTPFTKPNAGCTVENEQGSDEHSPQQVPSERNRSQDVLNDTDAIFIPEDGANDPHDSASMTTKELRPLTCPVDFHDINQVEDDELFYETLDAAFNNIMAPNLQKIAASRLQRHSSEMMTHQAIEQELEDYAVSLARLSPTCHGAEKDQGGGHPAISVADNECTNTGIQETDQAESDSKAIENEHHGTGSKTPWMVEGQPGLSSSTANQTEQRNDSMLAGFWRKNRLY